MYPQYGEPRFPPGQDFSSGPARVPIDHGGGMGRYPYPGYMGPEGSQYGAMGAQRGVMGPPYRTKPPGMGGPDGMYGTGWNSNYMGSHSKSAGGPYPIQTDMYGPGGGHTAGSGYPDVPPNAMGYAGAGSNFHGPPNPYIAGSSQRFSPYPQRMPPHVGMMSPHAPGSPGVGSEGESGYSGSVPPYPGGPPRTTASLASSGRTWSNQDVSQGGSWSQGGYPTGGPSTPGQPSSLPNTHSPLSQNSNQQVVPGSGQGYGQSGQQSFGPISPQTPYSNQSQQQLTKQSSISSIRDALLSGPNQPSKPYESPGLLTDQHSPMTPVVKGTQDGHMLSPRSMSRQDSQLSASDSLSGLSQDQLRRQSSVHQLENNVSQDLNSPALSQDSGGRPDTLGIGSPSGPPDHSSPSLGIHGKGSESKTPVLSPVTRNHSSLLNQYTYSDDQQRKEFLDSLFVFLEKEGILISRPPMICKMPLDLYRVYTSVQQHGGFLNVLEKRLWRDVIKSSVPTPSNINSSSTRTLQQYYAKFLLPYECHVTNTDLTLCQAKLESSLSRHTSLSSPGSQLSSDGDIREAVINHHPDGSDAEMMNETQQVNGDEHLSDKELASDRLGQRIKSSDSNDPPVVSNGAQSQPGPDSGGSGGQRGRKEGMEVPGNSENSMESFPGDMMDPLPEMSIQDAESVLGMSSADSPYPSQQPSGGPATPSGSQSVPSPSPYSSQFPRSRSSGFIEMGDPSMPHPPNYPPSYPNESANSPFQMSSRPSFPPGYSPLPQYEGGPQDMHHGSMGQPPYMSSSYPSSASPYPPAQSYPPGMYGGSDHMMSQPPPSMGMSPHDMPSYPGPHGMHPDWPWQPRSRMLSPLPPHLQSPSLHQRYLQHQQQMRQQALYQAQLSRSSTSALSHSQPRSMSDSHKIQWQEQNRGGVRTSVASSEEKLKALKSSPKPEAPPNKSVAMKDLSEALKRKLPDWSGCIEGTTPHLMKRRVLYSENCGQVEPWRVMMSLKSGLLAESTWALDTLNILLHDDRTVGFFYLKHHHSLLNALVDHYKMTLNAIFGLTFDDTPAYHPGYEGRETSTEETESTPELLSEAMLTDFDIAQSSEKDQEESKCIVPVSNVYDPEEMRLGRADDLSHVHVPSVDDELYFPDPNPDLSIMPQSKRKHLEECSKLQRVDQTPVHMLLKRELIKSQIPLHRNGRPLRSPRGRERSFLEEMRRRESLGRADLETNTTGVLKDTTSTSGDSRKEPLASPQINHTVKPRLDNVFTSPVRSHDPTSPTFIEEHEIHHKEPHPLWTISPSREKLQSRCLCISNILRSLSFIPGNDHEFSQHAGILLVLGRLLLLHHDHLVHSKRKALTLRQASSSEDKKTPLGEKLTVRHEEKHFPPCADNWWWDCLDGLKEDTLVILSNISGQLDLSIFPELIGYPIIDGLLHWSVCPSSLATDPLPDTALVSSLSPQRLVLETLAKMSISEVNVDLILATPPLTRLDLLFSRLGQFIGEKRHPVVRQFALVLLSNLAQGNDASSRLIGQQKMVVILLIQCIEIAEHNACSSEGKLIGGYNPDDPNSLSVAMLRRAATTLHCLSKIPANRTILLCHRDRILYLCVSHYMEHSVSSILMDVLFELGKL